MKKSYIISSIIALGLFSAPFTFAEDNNLVQLDLKRSSNNSVDVTLVTTDNYNDNVLVRKKSDNKYVILIPNVHTAGYKASNLTGVNDLVSNIDVKTVNDTTGGYTKVTLITTKPLDIKTKTKSKPAGSEDQEYNTIIAQANAVRNNISTQEPPKIREQKTEVTVNKVPSENNVKKEQSKEIDTANSIKNVLKEIKQPAAPKKIEKPEIKLTEINPEKIEKQNRKEHLAELVNEVKIEKALEEVPKVAPSVPKPVVSNEVNNISEMPKVQNNIQNKHSSLKAILSKIVKKTVKPLGILVLLCMLFSMARKGARKILEVNKNAQKSFVENLIQQPETVSTESFGSLTGHNKSLSWREKYKMYTDSISSNKNRYSFIKSSINSKRASLEKLVSESSIENTEPIQSEDNVIPRTIKFKAFDKHSNSLKMTNRNEIRSRFKKYEIERPLHKQNTVVLEDTPLNVNKRSLKDANLKAEEVDSRRIKFDTKEYIMSSVDEYLSILDQEKNPANIKATASITNPINRKPDFFKGSIVKSGYEISPNKGFYLVNKGGKNSLVGKMDDRVFVLKNFEGNVTNPIQVRHDNANVYMVKAGGFKSLVEVNEKDMGVLIEL